MRRQTRAVVCGSRGLRIRRTVTVETLVDEDGEESDEEEGGHEDNYYES